MKMVDEADQKRLNYEYKVPNDMLKKPDYSKLKIILRNTHIRARNNQSIIVE